MSSKSHRPPERNARRFPRLVLRASAGKLSGNGSRPNGPARRCRARMRSSLEAIERQAGPNRVSLVFGPPELNYPLPHQAPLRLERKSPAPATAATLPSPDPDPRNSGTPPRPRRSSAPPKPSGKKAPSPKPNSRG
jgi:hypothetical protein